MCKDIKSCVIQIRKLLVERKKNVQKVDIRVHEGKKFIYMYIHIYLYIHK